ncbi:Uu.00g074320.m01.CDS01 [Anthostomella pinea]|uniref:Uu.00g074320.m01.CDS01 n=1 Tax=Anthostomella pinea TaxID=933095 RepID=A0AAI8YLM4_9PEZI|nr:Uu.00g074320.m01.CDS01 [Anthostomella pinea]
MAANGTGEIDKVLAHINCRDYKTEGERFYQYVSMSTMKIESVTVTVTVVDPKSFPAANQDKLRAINLKALGAGLNLVKGEARRLAVILKENVKAPDTLSVEKDGRVYAGELLINHPAPPTLDLPWKGKAVNTVRRLVRKATIDLLGE